MEAGGLAPSRWAIFRKFLEKKAVLTALDHISHVIRAIENTRFLTFKKPIKKIKLFSPSFACNLSPKHV